MGQRTTHDTCGNKIRERLGIKEDSYLEAFQIGKTIIATSEKLAVKELSDSVQKEMYKSGISPDDSTN